MRIPRAPIPSCEEGGFLAGGRFCQGRAPCLRAPEGSLDGSCRTLDNCERGNGSGTPVQKGHFYWGEKGDMFIKVPHG